MSDSSFKKDLLKFGGINATTGNMLLKGNVRANGNGSAFRQLSVAQLLVGNLTVVGNAVIPGISFSTLNVAGNVTSGGNFIGNGALMTGVTSTLPTRANLDIIGNVTAPGNVNVSGQVTATGNVVANYFVGNGALLTGLLSSLPTRANIDIVGNVTAPGNVSVAGQVNVTGNVVGQYFIGNGSQLTGLLSGLPATANIDIVGNVTAPGNVSVAGQVNVTGNVVGQYFLGNVIGNTVTASSLRIDDTSYFQLQGNNSILAFDSNDYLEYRRPLNILDVNIGANTVATFDSQGNLNVTSNVVAPFFVGNGSQLTGITAFTLPATANIDIRGNVTAPGNVSVAGQVNVIGNVVGQYFIGNGSQLTGITAFTLPATANIDIRGNVIAPGNVVVAGQVDVTGNVIGQHLFGDVAVTAPSLRIDDTAYYQLQSNNAILAFDANDYLEYIRPTNILNLNIGADTIAAFDSQGNLNVLSNVIAPFFVGNGSQLTGVTSTLPTTANLDIIGNVTAAGNVIVAGQVNVTGNVTANYFLGNGALLSGVTSTLPLTANIDIIGNVIGTYANISNLILNSASVLLGNNAGSFAPGGDSVAIGGESGANTQGTGAVAVGYLSGEVNQGVQSVAVGYQAGRTSQGNSAIALGPRAGDELQSDNAIAIGTRTGELSQGYRAIAIGHRAAEENQGESSIAIGTQAGRFDQGNLSIAIGRSAGSSLGNNSIAIGAFTTSLGANTIVLNATGSTLEIGETDMLAIAPIRGNSIASSAMLMYNTTTKEVSYNTSGNVSADYFLGNGALLTGIVASELPATANINIVGNVSAPGNVDVAGQVTVVGNAVANYFLGNGALLTGIVAEGVTSFTANGSTITTSNLILTTDKYLGIDASNSTALTVSVNGVNTGGNLVALSNVGFIEQVNLDGYLMVPQGYVADTAARLAVFGGNAPIGTFVTQLDTGNSYILTTSPSNVNANWFTFDGVNFPVNTVFGRTDDVIANYGDYEDDLITLSAAVGTTPLGNSVAEALQTLQLTKANIINGNVSASYFLGNGALLTGITAGVLPSAANIDIVGNVSAPGNVDVAGQVTVVGNVIGQYFLGNGALLTGVAPSFTVGGQTITTSNLMVTTDQYLSIVTANSTALTLSVNGVNTGGNLVSLANTGFVAQTNLNGFLMVPQGYVANAQVRLELAGGNAPVGTLVTQVDTGNTYLLTATPSNIDINWLTFTGTNFPVTTVFGRTGDVLAAYGDYPDNYIPLVANVGTTPAGNSVAEALQTLQTIKANIINGNISASYFIGNGALLTGITSFTLPSTANIDIVGNVSAPGNVDVAGQVTVVGNVVADYFVGNGSQLTGLLSGLPSSANIDIVGNVTAPGNISVAGQINTIGNVVAPYFLGNGALLTGITAFTLPATANIDIQGNLRGAYANVFTANAFEAFIGNVVIIDGIVSAPARITTNGNVIGQYFIGNGSQLSGVLTTLPAFANIDILGNVTGNTITTETISASANLTVSGSATVSGNVTTGGYFVGNGYYLTLNGLTLIPQGNVANASVRLALTVPPGSLITQTDNNTQYLLTTLPANANTSWLEFTGTNFPVVSVFGRTGAVTASPNDYLDSFIQLSANVGTATTTDHVSDALAYLNVNKANLVNGNVNASFFIGDTIGNIIGTFANVSTLVATNANVTTLIGGTGNIVTLLSTQGNVGNTRFLGGNVAVSGQVNVLGNVVAPFFLGNGSQLTGVISTTTSIVNGNSNVIVVQNGNITMAVAGVANAFSLSGNGLTIRGNIFNSDGIVYNVPASFARYVRTATQAITANSTANVVLTSVETSFGTDIIGNTTTGIFTLAPGKTYRLRGYPGFWEPSATAGYLSTRWFNVTTSTNIGSTAQMESTNNNYIGAGFGGTAEVTITPSVTTQVVLQARSDQTGTIGKNQAGSTVLGATFAWVEIEVVGGQSPLTSISQIANNLTANTLFVSGNVVGNLAMASNVRIFSQQMPFMWNPAVLASPIVTGNNIVVATAQGANGTYDGTQNGWRFTNGTNQYGSLAWNTGFDFRRDFRIDTGMYFSAFGGGNWISVGGSTNGGTSAPNAVNNGALTVSINYASGTGFTYLNTATLSSNPYHLTASSATWYSLSVVVQTVAGKRFLTAYLNNGPVETSADVTTWVPTGSFLVVGGNTAATTNAQYLNNVRLSYL
jgi:cytoskeletal protein CcmA (bactofilin family)